MTKVNTQTQTEMKNIFDINWKSRAVCTGAISVLTGCAALAFPTVVTPDMLQGASPVSLIQLGLFAIFFKS